MTEREVNQWFYDQQMPDDPDYGTALDPLQFLIGCADYPDRPVLMRIIQAAQYLCGMNKPAARLRLRQALVLLDSE
jgi:hypothetical protein